MLLFNGECWRFELLLVCLMVNVGVLWFLLVLDDKCWGVLVLMFNSVSCMANVGF